MSAEKTFCTVHSLHPDYRNVTADAKCSKLENFFFSLPTALAFPPLFSHTHVHTHAHIVSLCHDVKTRCSQGGFFSDFSPPRAWQFSFEGGTLRRIVFSLNIAKYAGNEEVTSLRALPGPLINSASLYRPALLLFCTYY